MGVRWGAGVLATARAVLVTMRPRQWVKNLFVAAPLVFSKNLTDPALAARAGLALLAFCLLSGAVYAFNDVRDAEADRRHPSKRRRPIASGALGETAALVAAALLAGTALVACASLSWMLFAAAAGYLANNLAYSLALKKIAFLDVLLIAVGFLLRVMAGGLAIDVPVSPWLLACTGLLASLLGFGKRAHELLQAEAAAIDARTTRASLAGYRVRHLRWAMTLLAIATSAAYALYTQDHHTVSFFGTHALLFTLPFCLFGIARFAQLALWRGGDDSPTDAILRDPIFLLNLLGWAASVVAIIYRAS
jgi:decaprenyl-phosphate phosphoribosyltransferase